MVAHLSSSPPRNELWKNALAAAVGVASILGVYAFARVRATTGQPTRGPAELPTCVLLLENANLDNVRGRLLAVKLEHEIQGIGLQASGIVERYAPAWGDPSKGSKNGAAEFRERLRYLAPLPGAKPGDTPRGVKFDDMTDAEYVEARKYFGSGGWVSPRIASRDAKSYVIRIAPGDPRKGFLPGTAEKLSALLEQLHGAGWKGTYYSRALGMGGDVERNLINAVFGVQTSWVLARAETGDWRNQEAINALEEERAKTLQLESKTIRSYTTPGSFVGYYLAARYHDESRTAVRATARDVTDAFEFARREGLSCNLSPDGVTAIIDVTTDAEGDDNDALNYRLADPLRKFRNVKVDFYRRR